LEDDRFLFSGYVDDFTFVWVKGYKPFFLPLFEITNKANASLRFIKRNVKTNSIKTKELPYKTCQTKSRIL
jgi:hypothetical protein